MQKTPELRTHAHPGFRKKGGGGGGGGVLMHPMHDGEVTDNEGVGMPLIQLVQI